MKRLILMVVAETIAVSVTAAACDGKAENLLVNAAFHSSDGFLPDGWAGLRSPSSRMVYSTSNGVLSISGVTSNYANWASQSVAVDPSQSYFFSVDVSSDALSGSASIVYSVLDGERRKIVADRPILSGFSGPQREWTRVGAVIPMPPTGEPRKLSIGFIRYNASRRPGADDAVRFRNPSLCVYTGQKPMTLPVSSAREKVAVLPDNPFPHNFTGEAIGTAYRLERGGVGFLRMNSGVMPRAPVRIEVATPPGVEKELYLARRGSGGMLSKIKASVDGIFEVDSKCDWVIWGNALLFRAGDDVGKSFEIRLKVTSCGKTLDYVVPVSVFDGPKNTILPAKRRFNSWQVYPVARMDTKAPANVLARALSDYWNGAGLRHTPFVEIDNALPARIKSGNKALTEGDSRLCDVAVDANGAPLNAWCDTDWISRGSDHYVRRLRSHGLASRLDVADYAMWDYEPYNEGPVTCGCFCERCRRAFASANGFENVSSGRDIIASHKAEWVVFRCRQRADVVRIAVEAVRKINPSIKFIFCSMPGDPGNDPDWMLKYGIDLPLYEAFTDIYATMNYSQSLDFFRSLEAESRTLRKESRMFVSNGWGRENDAKLVALQLVGAFFAGVDYPFIGQGLYVAQCDQVAAIRAAMDFIARTESQWGCANYCADKLPIRPGFRSEKSVWSLERKTEDGVRHVMIFNVNQKDDAYAHLDVPGEGELVFELAPRTWKYVELSSDMRDARKAESERAAAAEAAARRAYQSLFSRQKAHGMTTEASADGFKVESPAQTVEFDLSRNGVASWTVGGVKRADFIGVDYFTTSGMFTVPRPGRCVVEKSEIDRDCARVVVAYTVGEAPYDGLVVRRRYTIERDAPRIAVELEVVPEGGYRQFRLRTGFNLRMAAEMPAPTDVSSVYRSADAEDASLSHVAFVRDSAKFPDGKAFFTGLVGGKAKCAMPLAGGECIVDDLSGDARFVCRADSPDEIFGWRGRSSASVEFIFPDAYDHYDPHAVKTWKTSYSVELKKRKGCRE